MKGSVLLWLDVETTGLDPQNDLLLQVACILTDSVGNVIAEPREFVVLNNRVFALSLACEVVVEMHDATGLWDRLESGVSLRSVEDSLIELVSPWADEPRNVRLAGNSVKFDLAVLEVKMPRLAELISYRVVDCSSLAYAFRAYDLVDGNYKKDFTHDAVRDIEESLSEYRWLMGSVARKSM